MQINEDSLLVIEEGEDLNIRFEKNPHVSTKPQIAERILVIHAPPSKDVNQALQFARDAGRSSHLIIGHDGKEIVQTVPFNVDYGNKRKKKNEPPRLKTKINGNQQFYRTGGGQPTPPVPGGPFPAGTRVRKQEENGKWTLVVVQDYIKDETGFEGWVNSGLVSKKRIPKSTLSISGVPPGLPLWQHKDDQELGDQAPPRPHPRGDPAVFPLEKSEAARVDLTKEWQFFIRAINYKMLPDKVSAIFGNLRAFCNHTGLGDAGHPRADFLNGENLSSPLPQLDKVRYPLSRLHRLPPNSEIPSPYKP